MTQHCLRCGYKIKSPTALLKGYGGGCQHKISGKSTKWQNRLRRTVDLEKEKDIKIAGKVWKKDKENNSWISSENHVMEDKWFKDFLMRNNLVLSDAELNNIDLNLLDKVKNNLDDFFDGKLDNDLNLTLDKKE